MVESVKPDQSPTIWPQAPVVFLTGVKSFLHCFIDIFTVPTDLQPIKEQDHWIPLLLGSAPVNVWPYRYPDFQKSKIEKLVSDMLIDGIICPSTSPFSSPVHLVKKKDGSWRLCVDYRALNAFIIKDQFSIPTVEEILDEIGIAQVFSELDIQAWYRQVRIYP